MNNEATVAAHWSFWVISVAGLLFNLLGCMNYLSQMNADSVAAMPDVYRAMIEIRPAWATGAFAIAVFGGALGCVALLLRKTVAFYILIVALLAALAAQLPFIGYAELPFAAWLGWLSQAGVAAFLVWFARHAAVRDWIR